MGAWVLFRIVFTVVPPESMVSLEPVRGEDPAASMLLVSVVIAVWSERQSWDRGHLVDTFEVATVPRGER